VKIPTWRATKDISIPEDLAEEIARVIGFDNIPPVMPLIDMKPVEIDEELLLIRKIRNH